jgi:hypothetical protein
MTGSVQLQGKPLKFALIKVFSSSSGKTAWVWTTDKDGRFTSKKLQPGFYRVEISGWGITTIEIDPPKLDGDSGQNPNWFLDFSDDGCVAAGFMLD